jgi:hypothetical protein
MYSSRYEIEKVLTGTLPSYVYILPVVDDLSNVIIEAGSGSSPSPAVSEGRYLAISGVYLRIRVNFSGADSLKKILIFKIT